MLSARSPRLVIILLPLVLSGCAGMSGEFHCNHAAGDSCQTISEVNHQVDTGAVSDTSRASRSSVHPSVMPAASPARGGFALATPTTGRLVRGGEQVQRIWLGPYQDTAGNYHEPAFVYTVLAPSHWMGPPPTAIAQSDQGANG